MSFVGRKGISFVHVGCVDAKFFCVLEEVFPNWIGDLACEDEIKWSGYHHVGKVDGILVPYVRRGVVF
jgi:hypothetical protein